MAIMVSILRVAGWLENYKTKNNGDEKNMSETMYSML